MRPRTLPPIAALAALAAPLLAEAADLRVPADYPTINDALAVASSGDVVLVAPGTYRDLERIENSGDPVASVAFLVGGVTLRSEAGPEVTIIDPGEAGPNTGVCGAFFQDLDEEVWIEGLTFTGGSLASGVAGSKSPNLTVENCVFVDFDGRIALGVYRTDLDMLHCRVERCTGLPHYSTPVDVYAGDVRIEDSEFIECERPVGLTGNPVLDLNRAKIRRSSFLSNTGPAVWIDDFRTGVEIEDCRFEDNVGRAALTAWTDLGLLEMRRCVFAGNRGIAGTHSPAAAHLSVGGGMRVENCTFSGNTTENERASAIDMGGLGWIRFTRNIVEGGRGGTGAVHIHHTPVDWGCNVYWDNDEGPGEYPPGPGDRIADPRYCDREARNFTVEAGSPCLPGLSEGCGPIGAFGLGCGTVSLERTSWGTLKSLYRTGGD